MCVAGICSWDDMSELCWCHI